MSLLVPEGWAQVNVYTRSYDSNRTGANLNEKTLSPANVNAANFGKLYTVPIDAQVYAQPLYVSGLSVHGSRHDVVFVASMRNTVYAIDAPTGAILWQQNYGAPIHPQEVQQATIANQNISWNTGLGILSTPVIDPATNYMYFVSSHEYQNNSANVYEFHLNAIDITTGAPVHGSPVIVNATYSTADLVTPVVFVPKLHNPRPGLALANGNVYMAFASHNDIWPYYGWVMAYSTSTLAQTGVYCDTPLGEQGGIWNAGGAPPVDADGNLYYSTGNGAFGPTPNGSTETGNSFIKLSPSLQLLDYFTPYNSPVLNAGDQDLGASGLLLLPGTDYMLGGGKQGVLYLVDKNSMGGFNASADQVRQEFQAVYGRGTSHIHGGVTYFNSDANGPTTYVWGENDTLRAFLFNPETGLVNATPFAASSMTAPALNNAFAMPGGFTSISANGKAHGIVWASTPYDGDAAPRTVQGVLYAFDAETLALLWTDKTQDARDEVGMFAKFVPPMVANGRMFIPTFGPLSTAPDGTGQLVAYGLLPQLTVNVASLQAVVGNPLPTLTGTVSGLNPADTLGAGIVVTYSTTATANSPAGSYPITATVSGSSAIDYRIGVNPGTLTINPATVPVAPDFSFTVNPGALTVPSGQSSSVALAVHPAGGLAGSLSVACSGLPQYASCAMTGPASLTGSATTANLGIATSAGASAAGQTTPGASRVGGLAAGGLTTLAALLLLPRTFRRRRLLLVAAGVLSATLLLLPVQGCGGSSTFSPAVVKAPILSAAPGTYQITITVTVAGASPVTHSQPLTLVIE
jgi:hypothetical protein